MLDKEKSLLYNIFKEDNNEGSAKVKLLPFKSVYLKLLLLSLMHFAVDGLCSYLVFGKLYPNNVEMSVLIFFGYNILAFVTQSPVGSLIDRYNKPKFFLGISIIALILGYLFTDVWIVSVLFIGVGNSVFHVAGGKYVTDKSGNDISHLGIFVSTGAVGLVLGQRYFDFLPIAYILFSIFIVCGLLVIFSSDSETVECSYVYKNADKHVFALLAVIGVVVIRSFVGKIATPDFDLSKHMFLIIAIGTALGKAMGGVCSKFLGVRVTAIVSLSISAICLTLGTGNAVLYLLGVFAFNFSMPITLYYANILLKGSEGFAFGTLAAALAPGFFIASCFTYSIPMRICTVILCVISILIIAILSKRIHKYDISLNSDSNS